MAGYSLHIGLNFVDPSHYNGWDGELNACEKDAIDMELIASSKGFKSTVLLREKATRANVRSAIINASSNLNKDDIFYISYSGHGGRLPDFNGDEIDGLDETWCLFDGQLIDDELKYFWSLFKKGTRILVTSDSCHSGTIVKSANHNSISYSSYKPRYMDTNIALTTYMKNKEYYDDILNKTIKMKKVNIDASVLLISGCQDNQYSYDGPFNGQFTSALKNVWNGGAFNQNYKDFHRKIVRILPSYQTPNYLEIGNHDYVFSSQIPFAL